MCSHLVVSANILINHFGSPAAASSFGYSCCFLGSWGPAPLHSCRSARATPHHFSLLCRPSFTNNHHYTSPNLTSSSSAITRLLLPTLLSCCPSDILHVVVHSNPIFPCSIAHNPFYSMISGCGNQSPHAKHHHRSSHTGQSIMASQIRFAPQPHG